MSARVSIARARASFIFHPPDSEVTPAFCMLSVKPTEERTRMTSSRGSSLSRGSANTYSTTLRSASSP